MRVSRARTPSSADDPAAPPARRTVGASEVRLSAWLLSGRAAPGIAQAAFLVVAARLAGAEVLGLLAVGTVTAQWLSILADFGSGDLLLLRVGEGGSPTRYLSAIAQSKLGLSTAAALIAGVVGLAIGSPYGAVVAAAPALGLAMGVAQPLTARLVLADRTSIESGVAWLEAAMTLAVGGGLLLANQRAWIVIVGFGAVRWIGNLIRHRAGRRALPLASPDDATGMTSWDVMRQGLPFVAFLACLVLFFQADVVVLAAVATPAAVGLYQVAWRLAYFPGTAGEALVQVLLPRLAAQWAAGVRRIRLLVELIPLFVAVGVAIALGLLLAGPAVVRVLFGAEFAPATELLRIMALGVPIRFANYAIEVTITSSGRLGRRLVAVGVYATVTIALITVGAVVAGARGVAWARVAGEAVVFVCYLTALWTIPDRPPPSQATPGRSLDPVAVDPPPSR